MPILLISLLQAFQQLYIYTCITISITNVMWVVNLMVVTEREQNKYSGTEFKSLCIWFYYGIRLLWINCNKVYTCTKTCTKALFAVSKQWSPKKNNTLGICLLKHLFYCSEKKYTGLYVSFFKYYVHNSSWLNWTEKIYKHYYCTA